LEPSPLRISRETNGGIKMKRNSNGVLCNDKWWENLKETIGQGGIKMIIKDEDVLKEAIRLITGDEAEEIQLDKGDEPNLSYQREDGTWFVMMVYNMEYDHFGEIQSKEVSQ